MPCHPNARYCYLQTRRTDRWPYKDLESSKPFDSLCVNDFENLIKKLYPLFETFFEKVKQTFWNKKKIFEKIQKSELSAIAPWVAKINFFEKKIKKPFHFFEKNFKKSLQLFVQISTKLYTHGIELIHVDELKIQIHFKFQKCRSGSGTRTHLDAAAMLQTTHRRDANCIILCTNHAHLRKLI